MDSYGEKHSVTMIFIPPDSLQDTLSLSGMVPVGISTSAVVYCRLTGEKIIWQMTEEYKPTIRLKSFGMFHFLTLKG